MKRTKTIIILLLALAIVLSVRDIVIRSNTPVVISTEQAATVTEEATPVTSVDAVKTEKTVEHAPAKENTPTLENKTQIAGLEPVPLKTTPKTDGVIKETVPEPEDETGISIVQVALMDNNSGLGDIIYVPEEEQVNNNPAKGFHVNGNPDNKPLTLIVNTQLENGTETLQFLPWNPKSPNDFQLHSELGVETVVTVYQGSKKIDQFTTEEMESGEIIALNIDLNAHAQLASL